MIDTVAYLVPVMVSFLGDWAWCAMYLHSYCRDLLSWVHPSACVEDF